MLLNYTGKNGELNFEKDLVSELIKVGWEKEIIKNPTEDDLIENWRKIIYDNNKVKLNDVPLSDYEMSQIMEYIKLNCNTPVKANLFINALSTLSLTLLLPSPASITNSASISKSLSTEPTGVAKSIVFP